MNMSKKDIELLRLNYLRGPNIWTYRPVIEALVDIGELEDFPSNTLPGFNERLSAWLPGLIEHRCSEGRRGGFLSRLAEGTWPAHIMEHVAIELQNLAGMKVGFGKARSTSQRGIYKVAVRARNEQVGRAALMAARDLVMAAINDKPYDLAPVVEHLRVMVDDHYLGPSTACIVEAATERSIPWIRLTDGNLVQLGHSARQRRIWTAETDKTSAIAEGISSDKDLTKSLLSSCGVPVPEGRIVESPEEAWEAAQDIGLPVVVKPSDANHGRGVSLELDDRATIEAAFHLAEREGSEVIVERFIRGDEHRLLVVGSRVVAAARGESVWMTGDGVSTCEQLIESQVNSDPRRGDAEEFPLETIVLDRDANVVLELQRQGLTRDSVPAAGRRVLVQRNGNVAMDVTDKVHPEVAEIVAMAARVVGLDIAGIDLVAQDISRPLEEQGGAIVEVNAGPGLLMHLKPSVGEPRPVGRAIIEHLFPEGDAARIPIVGVAGGTDATLVSRLIAWLTHLGGLHVGLACRAGLYLDRRLVEHRSCANWTGGQRLLMNRAVQAAVFENDAEMILREGLAYDRCQVGVVTDMGSVNGLAPYYVDQPEQLFNVLRTQVDVVMPEGVAVLNADDAEVLKMAELCDGDVFLYGQKADSHAMVDHRERGGRALFVRGREVILATGADEIVLVSLDVLDRAPAAAVGLHVEHALPAFAAALSLGIAPALIRAGMETFEPTQGTAAGAGSF
ncbi:cyanophycin synthetase [Uliginosibacterium sp. sgz301328]|uniref:cyanophycin synthetase n=1 Tax=Uliginosibacterium sp. sgz301328 TaxID=3243764 RepID=UPI00359D7EE8